MASPAQSGLLADDFQQLAEMLVDLIEYPAAIITGGELILAHNNRWARVTRQSTGDESSNTLECCLRDLLPIEPLTKALRQGVPRSGQTTEFQVALDGDQHELIARWHQLILTGERRTIAVVVLHDPNHDDPLQSLISYQRAKIENLLNRQTLIEEAERRRIGLALHDITSQSLALIRMRLLNEYPATIDRTILINTLDLVIDNTRTLAFELSPPILEDMGLRPALEWLAEHLSMRYDAKIRVIYGDDTPSLSHTVRTIVFRAVRELVINAAKYAQGTEIDISCTINGRLACVAVQDGGPGFDADAAMRHPNVANSYGLLSVQRQIQGVGGRFELTSSHGHGTRGVIYIPIDHRQGDQR